MPNYIFEAYLAEQKLAAGSGFATSEIGSLGYAIAAMSEVYELDVPELSDVNFRVEVRRVDDKESTTFTGTLSELNERVRTNS